MIFNRWLKPTAINNEYTIDEYIIAVPFMGPTNKSGKWL
jgi:hypothetical protein